MELAPGTKVSTLAAESSSDLREELEPAARPVVLGDDGEREEQQHRGDVRGERGRERDPEWLQGDQPGGARPAEHEQAAADHGRAEQPDEVLLVDEPRPDPAGVGDQQRADDQSDRLDHAVRDREPHAPVGDEVAGHGREGQQRGQHQPPAHRR